MENKFTKYYPKIDVFDITKTNNITYDTDSETEDESFFNAFFPFNTAILMNYLKFIIYEMCDNFVQKGKVLEQIKLLYNEEKNQKDFKWKDISLKELIKGNYTYLKQTFIIKHDIVPNNNFFINNYSFPEDNVIYPFSLKELYTIFLERGINITINNYYLEKEGKSIMDFIIDK